MTWVAVVLLSAAPVAPRPALEQLARAAADKTKALPAEAPVAVFVEGSPPALARGLASLVSAELAALQLAPVVLEAGSGAEAETLARQHDLRTLVRLTVSLEGEQVWARGDVVSTWVNFWSGAAATRAGPAAVVTASAVADAQTKALAQATAVVTPSTAELVLGVSVWARLPSAPIALAAVDVDGDKRAEVAVLTDDAVLLYSPDAKLIARAELKNVPMAVSPSREAFGAIGLLAAPTRINWVSNRRKAGEQLQLIGGTLKPVAAMAEVSTDGVALHPVAGLNVFAAAAPFTAVSSRGSLVFTVYPDGAASLSRGVATTARFSGIGAGSALVDFDGDGMPEVAITSTKFFPDGDELRVLSLAAAENLQSRGAPVIEATPLWRASTPRGRAMVSAVGDLDGDGADELLLGAWLSDGTGEIQVVRRAR